MKLWQYLSRGYAILCIVISGSIELWNRLHPGHPGIPRPLWAILPLILAGVAAFPVFSVVEFLLWVLKRKTALPAFLSITLFLTATAFCLLGWS
jgi:hypothetical protein